MTDIGSDKSIFTTGEVAAMSSRPPRPTPWEFVCNWYHPEEIAQAIASRKRFGPDVQPIPEDVDSQEFAEWLTNEYRCAMNKGIEIGRRWDQEG